VSSLFLLDIGLCFFLTPLLSQHVYDSRLHRHTGTISAINVSEHPIELSSGEGYLIERITKVKRTHRLVSSDSGDCLQEFVSSFRSVKSFELIRGSIEIPKEVTPEVNSIYCYLMSPPSSLLEQCSIFILD
jgi:hypothetical protein